MYAEDFEGDQDALVASFQNLRQILTECLLKIRDGDNPEMFSMDDLFCQLQFGAESLEDATIVLDMIKEVWKEHSDLHLRQQLDSGITQLVEGKHKSALETFSSILSSDPLYGEAWNKKATVHYMLGEKEKSISAAEEALKLDQRNFQALAGLGLIEMDLAHYEKAIGYFRECLSLNPWLVTVSSMLARCMRKKETGSIERTGTEWQWPG
jgi:tetratricopeptide (TPR) repeat protein